MISGMTVSMFRSAKLHKGKKIYSNYGIKNTYSHLADIFTRKMMQDLANEKIETDEFRRFSRGISAIADYLDYKELGEMICQKCGSTNDVADFVYNGAKIILCADCRGKYMGKKIKIKGFSKKP